MFLTKDTFAYLYLRPFRFLLTLLFFCFVGSQVLRAQPTPFPCDGTAYQVSNTSVTTGTSIFSRYNINTGISTMSIFNRNIGAIGFNVKDNMIWGYDRLNNVVIQIGVNGLIVPHTIPNLPAIAFSAGEVNSDGYLILYSEFAQSGGLATYSYNYFVVDVDASRSTYLQLVDPTNGFALEAEPYGTPVRLAEGGATTNRMFVDDFAQVAGSPNLVRGMIFPNGPNSADNFKLVILDITTGAITIAPTNVFDFDIRLNNPRYSSIFGDVNGGFYVFKNTTGVFYKVDLDTYRSSIMSTTSPASFTDGASCPFAALSIPISGNVFNDTNDLSDSTVNGTGVQPGGLYAVAYNTTNGVVDRSVLVSDTGTFTINVASEQNYNIVLSTADPAIGSTVQPAANLPAGWRTSGENIGAGSGNNGTPTGVMAITNLPTAGLTDVNFGISQNPRPQSYNTITSIEGAPQYGVPTPLTTAMLGSDSGSAKPTSSSWADSSVVITSLPTDDFILQYNGHVITAAEAAAGYLITNYDPSLLSVEPSENSPQGVTTTSFGFATADAGGARDLSPATYIVNFSEPLPVTFGTINATIDGNMLSVNFNCLTEINNDHFIIKVSTDGTNFYAIDSLNSTAPNGNSDTPTHYSFSKGLSTMAMGSIAVFGLLALLSLFFSTKSRKWAFLPVIGMVVSVAVFLSCNKNTDQLHTNDSRVYVRIVQVDKDGTRSSSKIVTAVRK